MKTAVIPEWWHSGSIAEQRLCWPEGESLAVAPSRWTPLARGNPLRTLWK